MIKLMSVFLERARGTRYATTTSQSEDTILRAVNTTEHENVELILHRDFTALEE